MPEMIPERLPSGSTVGEKRVFEILQNLPEDCVVYYEPVIAQKYPDFIIISPRIGILVVEVKGWYPKNIISGDTQNIKVHTKVAETLKHPIRQAREYMYNLMDECRKLPNSSLLLNQNKNSEHHGKFLFPFGNVAILSNIEKQQLQQHANGNLSILFDETKTIYKKQLEGLKNLSPEKLELKLKDYFAPWWKFPVLSEKQTNMLRALIHPEIKLISNPTTKKPSINNIIDNTQTLKVLDIQQEKEVINIGEGHRIIAGVAGSGKTVILIARAKLLAKQNNNAEVLILCFNVALAAYLRETFREYKNIHTFHFDGWAKYLGCTRQYDESDEDLGERVLQRLKNGCGDTGRYSSIFVDETQDFSLIWFQCILEALQDRDNSDLLIVGDKNQGIKPGGNKKISWKQVGIKAQGRTKYLNINYRNTKKILEIAALFASNAKSDSTEDDLKIIALDTNTCLRNGEHQPLFFNCHSRHEETLLITSQVKNLLDSQTWQRNQIIDGIKPEDIGILYRHASKNDRDHLNNLLNQLRKFTKVVWLNESSESRNRVAEAGVKVQTIHSSKGLQYKVVIIMWADLLPATFEDIEEEQERNLFYVALTRAEECLMITATGSSKFTDIVESKLTSNNKPQPILASAISDRFEDFDDDIPF